MDDDDRHAVKEVFRELYVEYVREGRIEPASDPRAAFNRAYDALNAISAPGHGDGSARGPTLDTRGYHAIDAAVIGHVSLPLLDAAERGAHDAPSDTLPGECPGDDDVGREEEVSLLPEPPTFGGWFVNRRQTLGGETPDATQGTACGMTDAQLVPGEAAWPQWLR